MKLDKIFVKGWMATLIEASIPVAERGIETNAIKQKISLLLFMK